MPIVLVLIVALLLIPVFTFLVVGVKRRIPELCEIAGFFAFVAWLGCLCAVYLGPAGGAATSGAFVSSFTLVLVFLSYYSAEVVK